MNEPSVCKMICGCVDYLKMARREISAIKHKLNLDWADEIEILRISNQVNEKIIATQKNLIEIHKVLFGKDKKLKLAKTMQFRKEIGGL